MPQIINFHQSLMHLVKPMWPGLQTRLSWSGLGFREDHILFFSYGSLVETSTVFFCFPEVQIWHQLTNRHVLFALPCFLYIANRSFSVAINSRKSSNKYWLMVNWTYGKSNEVCIETQQFPLTQIDWKCCLQKWQPYLSIKWQKSLSLLHNQWVN